MRSWSLGLLCLLALGRADAPEPCELVCPSTHEVEPTTCQCTPRSLPAPPGREPGPDDLCARLDPGGGCDGVDPGQTCDPVPPRWGLAPCPDTCQPGSCLRLHLDPEALTALSCEDRTDLSRRVEDITGQASDLSSGICLHGNRSGLPDGIRCVQAAGSTECVPYVPPPAHRRR